MIKMTTLAVLGLAASGLATAGSMGPVCTPGNVTVPCAAQGWDIGVQALYLKTVYDANRGYQTAPGVGNTFTAVNNDWDWGYRLEGSYHFNMGNDATVTWMHYQSDTNRGLFVGFTPVSLAPFTYNLFNENQFDQVNMVMGQHVDVSMNNKMRFYGGLQYAHILSNTTNFYNTPVISPLIRSINQFDNADYKGLGPVIGVDYAYNFTNEFSLTANGATSVLYGTSRFSNGYVGTPVNVVLTSRSGKKRVMVPSLEAKLGVNYAYNMGQGTLNLEAGYQAVDYFNALQSTGVAGFFGPIGESDYGLYGPYFGVKYVGNA